MSKKAVLVLLSAAILFAFGWRVSQYLQLGPNTLINTGQPIFVNDASSAANPQQQKVEYEVRTFAENFAVPWSMVFTAPNRLLVSERPGRIREILDGTLSPEPIRIFPEVSTQGEEGLMSMAIDPDYEKNHWLYACIAYERENQQQTKIIRLTDLAGQRDSETVLLDNIPASQFHAGCRIRFGPDGKLYISTGDATNKQLAQDTRTLNGKMLRINSDGSIPNDNPFGNSPVFSYGHRNPQGFDWHPVTGALIETEHGPTGNDGPGGGDEVNLIQKGQNYGWPVISHEKSQAGMESPLLVFTPAVAPASGMFYRGSALPQFTNTFLFGMLKGEGIMQVQFDEKDSSKVVFYQKIPGVDVGRVRDIVEGPDGNIYFTSSNTDSRGKKRTSDDKIYQLVPKQK